MIVRNLWIIPVISATSALLAFGIGYGIAVGKGLAHPWISYISDGGAFPPESGVFGELLNIAAFLMALTVYLRHQQFATFHTHDEHIDVDWTSLVFQVIGWVSAFGMTLVANFQEFDVPMVHRTGAWLCFVGSTVYIWGQVILAYRRRPPMTPLWLNHFRLLLALLTTGSMILHLVSINGFFVRRDSSGQKPYQEPARTVRRYSPESPFYLNHLVAGVSEWIVALCVEAFVFSLGWDFSHFDLRTPQLKLNGNGKRLVNTARIAPMTGFDGSHYAK